MRAVNLRNASLAVALLTGASGTGGGCAGAGDASPSTTTFGETDEPVTTTPTTTAGGSASSTSSAGSSGDGSSSGSEPPPPPPPPDCEGAERACGVHCVDVQTDPDNCGDCGISCVVPNATAVCNAGVCSLGVCDLGFSDCDGAEANGCEAEVTCEEGAACSTECGSVGRTSCATCEPVCEMLAESCNGMDDDCNGACDDGPIEGCRIPVHRANGPNGHYYTTVLAETSQEGRNLEAENYWHVYAEQQEGMLPLHRCDRGDGRFFLTSEDDCEGLGVVQTTMGYVQTEVACGSRELYRLVSGSDRHFYTLSAAERDNAVNNLGYTSQGVSGFVWGSG